MKKHFFSLLTLVFAVNTAFAGIANFSQPHVADKISNPVMEENPDPDHIQIIPAAKRIRLMPHGFDDEPVSKDTRNLRFVFENYPKYDLLLMKGTFHISETIEAEAYQGEIKGQGKDKTFLVGRGPLNADGQHEFPLLNDDLTTRLYPSRVPHLLWFHAAEGDVNDWENTKLDLRLKDLTIRLDGVGPEITYFGLPLRSIWALVIVTGAKAVFDEPVGNISHIEVDVKDVRFQAQEVTYQVDGESRTNPNAAIGLIQYGGESWAPGIELNGFTEVDHLPVNGQLNFVDCEFNNLHLFGLILEAVYSTNPGTAYTFPTNPQFPESTIDIKNNTFRKCGTGVGAGIGIPGGEGFSLAFLAISETETNIRDNDFLEVPGAAIMLLRGVAITIPQLDADFNIKDNNIQMDSTSISASAIRVIDLAYPVFGTKYKANISDNHFSGAPGYNRSLTEVTMGASALIYDNTYSGNAESAVSLGALAPIPPHDYIPATGCTVADNDFTGLDASNVNVVIGGVSTFNTVVVKNESDVLDLTQGHGNNTIIVD